MTTLRIVLSRSSACSRSCLFRLSTSCVCTASASRLARRCSFSSSSSSGVFLAGDLSKLSVSFLLLEFYILQGYSHCAADCTLTVDEVVHLVVLAEPAQTCPSAPYRRIHSATPLCRYLIPCQSLPSSRFPPTYLCLLTNRSSPSFPLFRQPPSECLALARCPLAQRRMPPGSKYHPACYPTSPKTC